jgi:hypothetical protein
VSFSLYEKNIKAYNLLNRSCSGTPLGLIETVEDGNDYVAWQKLLNKHETKINNVQLLKDMWGKAQLAYVQVDPTDWFLKLTHINNILGKINDQYKKDSIQIAGFILNNAPKDYLTVITSLESSGKGKEVNAIQEAFEKHWEKNYKGKEKKEEAFNIEYKFKGNCNYCGIAGHEEVDCRKKKREAKGQSGNSDGKNYGGKKKMECWLCGGDHTKKECPKYNTKKPNIVNSIFTELFMCDHMYKKSSPKPTIYKEALMHEIYYSEIEQEGIDMVTGTTEAIKEENDATNVEENEQNVGFCSFCTQSGQYMTECKCGGIFKEIESDEESKTMPSLKERNSSRSTAGYNSDDEEEEDKIILIEMKRGDIQNSETPKLYTHGVPM